MQIHPGRAGFRTTLGTGGIARRCTGQRSLSRDLDQAEIQQHRQTVTVTSQQVAGIDISMHQTATVDHRQQWQGLPQQQQHLPCTEDHLTLAALTEDQAVGLSLLPVPHRPEAVVGLQQLTAARQLGMQQGLQPWPGLLKPLTGLGTLNLADHQGGVSGQGVQGTPKATLDGIALAQGFFQAVTLRQDGTGTQGAGFAHKPTLLQWAG